MDRDKTAPASGSGECHGRKERDPVEAIVQTQTSGDGVTTACQELSVPSTAASAVDVREFVRAAAAERGLPTEWIMELVLAVNEAFSNAIFHGTSTPADTIEVGIETDDEGMFVELQYLGEPFDVHVQQLPADIFQQCGRGRYLMHQLLDAEAYLFDQGMTTLRMFKHF